MRKEQRDNSESESHGAEEPRVLRIVRAALRSSPPTIRFALTDLPSAEAKAID